MEEKGFPCDRLTFCVLWFIGAVAALTKSMCPDFPDVCKCTWR